MLTPNDRAILDTGGDPKRVEELAAARRSAYVGDGRLGNSILADPGWIADRYQIVKAMERIKKTTAVCEELRASHQGLSAVFSFPSPGVVSAEITGNGRRFRTLLTENLLLEAEVDLMADLLAEEWERTTPEEPR